MKTQTAFALSGLILLCTACGTTPQAFTEARSAYMSYDGRLGNRDSQVIALPLDRVVANLERQIQACVPAGHRESTQRGALLSTNRVSNKAQVQRVSPSKAEFTLQQHHSNMAMQPEGGLIFAGADLHALDGGRTRIDSLSQFKHWVAVIPAWAKGEMGCMGIGGS